MRAARIVALVLLVLVSTTPGVAQRLGVPLGVYARKFNLAARPDAELFQFQWSHDPTFATQPLPRTHSFSLPFLLVRRGQRAPAEEEGVCYTARSYLYARESRDSDVTLPVGYRVCTPSTKFRVKSADLPPR